MSTRGSDDKKKWRLSRREFVRGSAALPASYAVAGVGRSAGIDRAEDGSAEAATSEQESVVKSATLTSVPGLKVGHDTRTDRPTGCTVVLAEEGAVGGVAVRGAAPGTRDTELLRPENTVEQVHAIVLSGGSTFGLAAADGVVAYLSDRGIGFRMGRIAVPIVPAAILFDLGLGGTNHPDAANGAAACAAASTEEPAEGNVGAGAGATVGKMFGMNHAMKGGTGSAGYALEDGTVVAALVAVNCRGDIRDPRSGRLIAGARTEDGTGFRDVEATVLGGRSGTDIADPDAAGTNTTIGVVGTNRALTKAECTRLAGVAHDGLARAIVPAHTRLDGDTLFVLSTGAAGPVPEGGGHDRLEVAAAAAVSGAILRAVILATGLPGLPSARELGTI